MGAQFKAINWNKRILIDICTQHDFLDAGSILQVANREILLTKLHEVFDCAQAKQLPIVSSTESHRPAEPVNGFPLHCIDDTHGQKKLDLTLIEPWAAVETDNYLSLPPDLRKNYRQLIFRKRTREVLSNPKCDCFLTQLKADEFIIFGVGLERAIRSLALGLLARKKNVAVISDACGWWSEAEADLAIRQLAAKGIRITTIQELAAAEIPAPRRVASRTRTSRSRSRATK